MAAETAGGLAGPPLPHFDGELLAWALRELRARRAMTQTQVALAASLSRSVVAHMESNRRRPFVDQLAGLAQALEINPALLLAAACREPERLPVGSPCVVLLAPDFPVAAWGKVRSLDWPAGVVIYHLDLEPLRPGAAGQHAIVPDRYVRRVR